MSDHLDAIEKKCKQYWNEHNIGDAEIHSALEFIYLSAGVVADEIERLRAELGSRDARIEKLEKLERFNYEELRKLLMDDGKHIITRDKISKAWDVFCSEIRGSQMDTEALTMLRELNIVACGECGGHGEIINDTPEKYEQFPCPACNGEGWRME